MQFTAPAIKSVLVIDPGLQVEQFLVDALLYSPAGHDSHFTAPFEPSVSVTDPAEHMRQLVCDVLGWYCPGAHSAHGLVDSLLY